MEIMEIINWITWIVTAASAIAASTPTKADDEFLGKVGKFIDLLAINIGKAKMQSPKTSTEAK